MVALPVLPLAQCVPLPDRLCRGGALVGRAAPGAEESARQNDSGRREEPAGAHRSAGPKMPLTRPEEPTSGGRRSLDLEPLQQAYRAWGVPASAHFGGSHGTNVRIGRATRLHAD